MNKDLEQLEELKKLVSELVKSKKKFIKLSEKRASVSSGNSTIKAIDNAEANLNWHAMHYDQLFRTVHAVCVDCGLSKPRDHYERIEYNPSSFHQYEYQPRIPKCRQK